MVPIGKDLAQFWHCDYQMFFHILPLARRFFVSAHEECGFALHGVTERNGRETLDLCASLPARFACRHHTKRPILSQINYALSAFNRMVVGLACLPSKDLADKALHGFEACRQPYIEITFPG
jgi:hypothetical protein